MDSQTETFINSTNFYILLKFEGTYVKKKRRHFRLKEKSPKFPDKHNGFNTM